MLPRLCSLLIGAALLSACSKQYETRVPGVSDEPFVPAASKTEQRQSGEQASAAREPEPSRAAPVVHGWLSLEVPGFLPAVMIVPSDPRPLPLFVATHGAGGSPEEACSFWHRIIDGAAILLCLRGAKLNRFYADAFYYPNHIVLEREFVAALSAIQSQLSDRIAQNGGVYAGYSQGATMGALMIINHSALFEHLILIEGGASEWSRARARTFKRNGGKKVLFACGGSYCADRANASARLLQQAGAETRVEHAVGAGHTYGGKIEEQVRAALPWLLSDAWAKFRRE